MMVLITEAKRSCVWWAGGPAPKPTALSFPPSPALRLVICSHRAPLYWPVASCSQSDPNLLCEVFPCTQSHIKSLGPPLLHTPSSRKGGKEEENSREWIGVGCDLYTTWQPIPQLVLAPQVEQMEQIDRIMFTHLWLRSNSVAAWLGVWMCFSCSEWNSHCIEEPMA